MLRSLSPQQRFSLLFLSSLIIYIVFRFWFPLAPYFDQIPQLDIRSFSPSLGAGLLYAILLIGLFGLYLFAYHQIRQMETPPALWVILATAVTFGLILLQTYPINATDIYRYVIRGRVKSAYGENQFAVPPNAFPDDPFAQLAGEWAGETSPYGPLWEMVATAVTAITKDNLQAGLLSFKTIGLLSHLGITAFIWQILDNKSRQHQAAYTLLWAWNPALLLTFVVNGHNDGFMILWLTGGVYFIRQQRPIAGFLMMVVAMLIKPIALLVLPLYFIFIWCKAPDLATRIRFVAAAIAGSLLLIWLAFLPFGSPLDLATRLVREASTGGGFSVTVLIVLINRAFGGTMPLSLVGNVARAGFGLFALWLAWRVWRNGRFARRSESRLPYHSSTDIFAAYILQAFSFRLWYATWLFPWTLLDGGEDNGAMPYRAKVAIVFLLTSQLSALIYGHLRVYALGGNQLLAHLIGVPFTFALPFLLAKIDLEDKG